jgi:hypothetical protein
MSEVISNSIVVVAIVLAAGYSVWRLGPRHMRDSVRARLSRISPSVFRNSDANATGACDACGGCAPAASSKPPAARKEHTVFWGKKPAR